MTTKVSDLTVDEFRALIREVVLQTLAEIFSDPDADLELRQDFVVALQSSLQQLDAGQETFSAEEVAARLGLQW